MKKAPTSVPGIGIRLETDVDVVMLDEKLDEKLEEELLVISGLMVLFCSKTDSDVEMLDEGLGKGVLVISTLMVLFCAEFEGELIIEISFGTRRVEKLTKLLWTIFLGSRTLMK